eukprot:CAMPEP_0195084442 /NCGR_PEP_ID=MMETSP0448-20130528/25124_1 /TAXON_ID=66468 /ORGANISM="Heterocapsa triquestra, Strain CCMP 448" /LENGTH=173 /DNA_ID=CAMNT_0040117753 /DNA_START=1 /DNA_END=522 /DNA_ORIENTATION=+
MPAPQAPPARAAAAGVGAPERAADSSHLGWAATCGATGFVLGVGAAGARRRPGGRAAGVARCAVDLPVRESEVKTTVAIPGAAVEEETRQKRADEYRLLLFNDPLNKREFVARCLMTICLLKEGDAYQVMMKAHKEGVAVVGTYKFETAEAYCEGCKAQGLSVDIIPVDGDDA